MLFALPNGMLAHMTWEVLSSCPPAIFLTKSFSQEEGREIHGANTSPIHGLKPSAANPEAELSCQTQPKLAHPRASHRPAIKREMPIVLSHWLLGWFVTQYYYSNTWLEYPLNVIYFPDYLSEGTRVSLPQTGQHRLVPELTVKCLVTRLDGSISAPALPSSTSTS